MISPHREAKQKLTVPAVLLLGVCIGNVLQLISLGIVMVLDPELPPNGDPSELGTTIALGSWFGIALIASIVTTIGAIQMLRIKSYAWSLAGAIVAVIPCAMLYCTLASIPVGIYAIVVLRNPIVRNAYLGTGDGVVETFS